MTASRPLRGLRLLVTRPEGRADDLTRRLLDLGAHVVEEPLTRTAPLAEADYAPLDRALDNLDRYDWLLFTSVEGVRYCLERAARRRHVTTLDGLVPKAVRLAAIGPKTAGALAAAGRAADLVAADHRAEGLVVAIGSLGEAVAGRRFLLVRAEKGRDVLPAALLSAGADVEVAVAYRTAGLPEGGSRASERIGRGEVDLVVATSGAALDELASALSCRPDLRASLRVAALGPVTAERARSLGFEVDIVARSATIESLVEALVERFGKES